MKNLLLLGDSIRLGYDSFVKEKLYGRMNVYFSEDNGDDIMPSLKDMLGMAKEAGLMKLDKRIATR